MFQREKFFCQNNVGNFKQTAPWAISPGVLENNSSLLWTGKSISIFCAGFEQNASNLKWTACSVGAIGMGHISKRSAFYQKWPWQIFRRIAATWNSETHFGPTSAFSVMTEVLCGSWFNIQLLFFHFFSNLYRVSCVTHYSLLDWDGNGLSWYSFACAIRLWSRTNVLFFFNCDFWQSILRIFGLQGIGVWGRFPCPLAPYGQWGIMVMLNCRDYCVPWYIYQIFNSAIPRYLWNLLSHSNC